MAALTNTQISVTYVGLLKTSANTVLSATAQQITDGSGNNTIMYLSTAGVGIGGSPTAGKELDVTGNVLITGDLQVDNININGNTISATSGVVTLEDGTIATTQSQSDNSTKVATTAYVDAAVTAEDLDFAGGSGTGSVDLDSQTFTIAGTSNEIETSASGQTLTIGLPDDVTVTGNLTVNGTGISLSNATNPTITVTDSTNGHYLTMQGLDGASKIDYLSTLIFEYGAGNTEAARLTSAGLSISEELTVSGTGQSSFGGQVTIPATPSASTDAASKGYVDSQVGANNELSEVLANGNTTGGTNISVTANDDIDFSDSSEARFGSDQDLIVKHNGTDGVIQNKTGDLYIENTADDKDIIFMSDNGSGGTEVYFELQGVSGGANPFTVFPDNSFAVFGASHDLQIYHNGSHSFLDNSTGTLYLRNTGSGDILLRNSTGGDIQFDNEFAGNILFNTSNITRLTIDSSGDATFAANVEVNGTLIDLDSAANATVAIDRGATSNEAIVSWRNAGSEFFSAGIDTTNNDLWSLLHTCGNGLYFDGVNMHFGIGTSSPDASLDILGTSGDQLRLRTAETEEYQIGRNSSTGYLDFYGTQSGYTGYVFGGVNGTRLTIDSSGKSTFAGNILATTTATGIELNQSSVGAATYYVMDNTVETGGKRYRFGYTGASADKGSFSIYNETDALMPLLISGANSTFAGNIIFTDGAAYSSAASIRQQSNNLILSGGSDGYYFNKSDNSATHMRISSGGSMFVGNTGPTDRARLDVTAGGATNFVLQARGTSNGADNTTTTDVMRVVTNDENNWAIAHFNASAYRFGYQSSGIDYLEIDTSGTVNVAKPYLFVGTQVADNGTTYLTLRNYDSTLVDEGDVQNMIRMSGRYWSGATSQLVETRITSIKDASNGNGGSALGFSTQTGGDSPVEHMRIDKDGNIGIGTSSMSEKLRVQGNSGSDLLVRFQPFTNNAESKLYLSSVSSGDGGYFYDSNDNTSGLFAYGDYSFYVGTSNISGSIGDRRMIIKQNGNIIVGNTSINGSFGASNSIFAVKGSSSGGEGILELTGLGNSASDIVSRINFHSQSEADAMCSIRAVRGSSDDAGFLAFFTNNGGTPTERAVIENNGYSRFTNSGGYGFGSGYNFHEFVNNNGNQPIVVFNQLSGSGSHFGINVINNDDENDTTSRFFLGQGGSTERIKIFSNGNIQNSNNSYGQLSDIKLKENVTDATDKLDELMQVQIKNFNYIGEEQKQIGVIAQEIEQIFPSLVYETPETEYQEVDKTDEEGNIIYQTEQVLISEAVEGQEAIEWEDKPTMDNTKVEIQTWLDDNEIEWQSADTKQELLNRIPEYQQEAVEAQDAVYETRETDQPETENLELPTGEVTKAVKYSVLVPIMIKAMQEQQEIINDLKARIENLEN